jgi:hypothetical protein
VRRRALALTLLTALLVGGCAGGSTFVSTSPPPDAAADAWFVAAPARVRNAVVRAMQEHGFALRETPDDSALVVGTKPQLGAEDVRVDDRPLYVMRCVLTRQGNTHVRATVLPQCDACDGEAAFQWEYPADLLSGVLGRTRTLLGERTARVVSPPRYRPPSRRRVPRRW